MRKSISMLTAIVFILIVALLLYYALFSLTNATKKTTDLYLYEQAELLGKSATEYAILAVQGHNFSNNCLDNININYQDTYDINITIRYIGQRLPSTCNILDNTLSTKESNGTAIIDVQVSLNPSLTSNSGIHLTPISYVRRTIQKL